MGIGRLASGRVALALALALASFACGAVPSFARQTGQPCATCHVGAFGPQLTEFGVQFKLGGYTMKNGGAWTPPLAGMVMAGLTHTRRAQDAGALDGHSLTGNLEGNDNLTLDQVSLFAAGRLAEHLGLFAQVTYDGIARQASVDNIDLRAAGTHAFDGHSLLYGVSLNNSPGVQDPFNTLPAWGFPYIASNVAPGPSAAAILDEAFGQKATGLVAYGLFDNVVYGELGTYRMQSVDTQKFFGVGIDDRDPGALRSPLYARLALRTAWDKSSLAGGLVLFDTGYQPDRAVPETTRIHDIGGDVSWRWTGPGTTATVLADVIHETQAGTSLTEYNVNGSAFWHDTWGATLQRFGVNAPGLGSMGTRLQLDWTPWGKAPIGFPDLNLRLGVQLTLYDEFDGLKGSAASDADSLFVFAWLAF